MVPWQGGHVMGSEGWGRMWQDGQDGQDEVSV